MEDGDQHRRRRGRQQPVEQLGRVLVWRSPTASRNAHIEPGTTSGTSALTSSARSSRRGGRGRASRARRPPGSSGAAGRRRPRPRTPPIRFASSCAAAGPEPDVASGRLLLDPADHRAFLGRLDLADLAAALVTASRRTLSDASPRLPSTARGRRARCPAPRLDCREERVPVLVAPDQRERLADDRQRSAREHRPVRPTRSATSARVRLLAATRQTSSGSPPAATRTPSRVAARSRPYPSSPQ